MEITIFTGKGGVGKSTAAAAYAMAQARTREVLLVDYDGGHSLAEVLALESNGLAINLVNCMKFAGLDLNLAIVDDYAFKPIAQTKQQGESVQDYLKQFVGDYGLLAFLDMIATFFGAPTDISTVSKFLSIIWLYQEAEVRNIEQIIIDVEPTAGLGRLLQGVEAVVRSLKNLQQTGWITLQAVGAKWPDVAAFLKGKYIQEADFYTNNMTKVAQAIREARFVIVTIPESSPVTQMTEVQTLVSSFGSQVAGYIINNIRRESYEKEQIVRVFTLAGGKPVVQIYHKRALCDAEPMLRRRALQRAGAQIAKSIH